MQICTSPQTDNDASTHHSVFTDWMPFLSPNQQRQSTEGKYINIKNCVQLTQCYEQQMHTSELAKPHPMFYVLYINSCLAFQMPSTT